MKISLPCWRTVKDRVRIWLCSGVVGGNALPLFSQLRIGANKHYCRLSNIKLTLRNNSLRLFS